MKSLIFCFSLVLTIIWVGGIFDSPSPTLLIFSFKLRNGKSCYPGTFQHEVTFHYRHTWVSLTYPIIQILNTTKMGVTFNIRNSGQTLTNKNCKKTRASINIDMKLAPVTKLDKKTTTTLKKIDDGAMSANYEVIFFQFLAGSRIPDVWSMILIFINKNLLCNKN